MLVNNKFEKSTPGLVSLKPKRYLVVRPVFWLVLALIAVALIGAIQWDHPQASIIAIVFGGSALLSIILAFWALTLKNLEVSLASLATESDAEGVMVTDSKGAVIYTNPAFHKLLFFATTEKPSRRIESLKEIGLHFAGVDPLGPEELERLISAGLDGRVAAAELAILDKRVHLVGEPESTIWRRIRVVPMENDEVKHRFTGHMIWRVSDVTDRREIDEVRLGEQGKINDLLDFLPIGIFSANGDGIILYANQTLSHWLGKPPERLIGTPFGDYVVGVGDGGLVTLKDGEGRKFLAKLEQTQKDAPDGDVAYTRSIVIRNALWDDPKNVLDVHSAPWSSKSFKARVLGASPTVDQSVGSLHGLFDEAPIGMVLLDLKGNITDANRAFLKMLDQCREAIVDRPIAEYLAREDRDDLASALSKIIMGTAPAAHIEVRIPGAGAREFTLSLYASRLTDIDSEPLGIILHLVDNTEQKNLEVQFAQSQKMQAVGQLAGGVAHDFNNLLTAMIGFCDLLLTRHGPNDPSFFDLQQIRQNANRATNLVRQLLAFSRKQTLEPVRLDITEALNDLTSLLRRLIGEKVELVIDHGRNLVTVMGDKSQFDQIVINLCVNARDAMPGGGTIIVRTENVQLIEPVQRGHDLMPIGRYVLVKVADTGTGISKENMERIFEPFFSTKEAGAGTGLGLSTVYGIVHQSGGFIFVDSAPGEGTTFSIYLPEIEQSIISPGVGTEWLTPIREASPNSIPSELQTIAQKLDTEKIVDGDLTGSATVLLVEDEDAVRMFAKRALENKGYTVLEAVNGEMALDVINATDASINIIVSDVIMPGMDGYTLVGLVRQELPGVKVILMSGYTEEVYREEIGRDATLHFLGKPFTLKDLAAKVKEALLE